MRQQDREDLAVLAQWLMAAALAGLALWGLLK